jgi:hypothetical protein
MTTELGREITAFLKEHGLKIVGSELGGTESGRNPTHIKLDGPSTGIKKFVGEGLRLSVEPSLSSRKMCSAVIAF